MFLRNRIVFSPDGPASGGAADDASPKKMTVDDLAASILAPVEDKTADETNSSSSQAATQQQEPVEDDDTAASSGDATGDADDNDPGDAQAGGGQDDSGDADDLDFDPFGTENTDDDADQQDEGADAETHEVTVDGEKVTVTLGELKRRYSGEAAIERRLQAATKAKSDAEKLMATAQSEVKAERSRLSADRNRLADAIKSLRSLIAAPMVKKPDPALVRTKPNEYNAQLAAYNADQLRVQQMNAKVDETLAANEHVNAQELQEQIAAEAAAFNRAVPAMSDPVKAPKVMQMITETAASIGFTPEEVKATRDHRLYVLALKAGMYDKLMASRKTKPLPRGQASVRPGGGDAAGAMGSPARKAAAAQARKVAKAKQTGAVADIAETLIVEPRRRRN